MSEITLNAEIRTVGGRSAANQLRRNGMVPGVFYLHKEENIPIQVKALDMRPLVYTADTHIVNLQLNNGTTRKCILREVQFDPITDRIAHFDLMGLVLTEKLRMEVPVVTRGAAPGVRGGGVLNHILHKVEVECLASDLPEHIEVDISTMQIGDIITVGSLAYPNVHIFADADQPVVSVLHARGVQDAAIPAETEVAAEPEVITRGKSSDE